MEPWANWEEKRARPKLDCEFTKKRFAGKVAVVTGGASGIGKATAERFVNDGAFVAVVDIDAKALESMQSEHPNTLVTYHLDICDKEKCMAQMAELAELKGGIHALVNSAGYFGSQGVDAQPSDWRKSFDVNVMGFANMVQACIPHMRKVGGKECSIVNVSSISAFQVQPIRWTYSATKAAIVQMTKCMALDLSEYGIRVNSIAPGWIWSREVAKAAEGDREKHEPIWGAKFHMVGRMGEAEECAAAATFLCSRDAAFITGTNLMVDGGYNAMGPEGLGEDSSYAATACPEKD